MGRNINHEKGTAGDNDNKRMMNAIFGNKGSVMVVEAAVYFPIIILISVIIIIFFVFKLDKMLTQAEVSFKTMEAQITIDGSTRYTTDGQAELTDVSGVSDAHVVKALSTSNTIYYWSSPCSVYPIEGIDYESKHSEALMDVLSGTTCHGFVIKTNPYMGTSGMKDVSLFRVNTSCGAVVKGKTGYAFKDYLQTQYPHSVGGGVD